MEKKRTVGRTVEIISGRDRRLQGEGEETGARLQRDRSGVSEMEPLPATQDALRLELRSATNEKSQPGAAGMTPTSASPSSNPWFLSSEGGRRFLSSSSPTPSLRRLLFSLLLRLLLFLLHRQSSIPRDVLSLILFFSLEPSSRFERRVSPANGLLHTGTFT